MKSLPLLQLIGAPIVAIIQAEAMAAHASAEFIETVGFVKQGNEKENTYGKLRSITFSYSKQDINGNPVTEEVHLPLLSLIPIPLLQVKDAQLSFNVQIIESITEITRTRTISSKRSENIDTQKPVSMLGVYKPVNISSDKVNSSTDVKISVNLVQSDIPAGLQQLFQIMENAATSRRLNKSRL